MAANPTEIPMDRHASARLLFAAALGAATPLASQAAPRAVCSSGRPADACRWFVITESRYQFNLTDAGTTGMRHYLLAEAGLLRNVSPTSAVGVTLWGGYDFGYEATRLGISARQRRWVSPHRSV